jgi:hypothetical protein
MSNFSVCKLIPKSKWMDRHPDVEGGGGLTGKLKFGKLFAHLANIDTTRPINNALNEIGYAKSSQFWLQQCRQIAVSTLENKLPARIISQVIEKQILPRCIRAQLIAIKALHVPYNQRIYSKYKLVRKHEATECLCV